MARQRARSASIVVAGERPAMRRLRVFSLDPALDSRFEMASISRTTIAIPWEDLAPGPVGEYLEIVDIDPASARIYPPVALDDQRLFLRDGHEPSTGNPQFHQQMVYAVAMMTIKNFERVLGREVMWSERAADDQGRWLADADQRYVPRLRIYPHALRDQNAYYSPDKRALLFGYFTAVTHDPREELPGGYVFTCLSHDIIAHEMTHAILDGIHPRLLEATNPDMLAFHEGFADIVAIFQHFTLPGLLEDQIQRTRGNLRTDSLLARLATQFARATDRGSALRNALGGFLADGTPAPPDPTLLHRTRSPHERGAILVAAVFGAFVRIYDARIEDLRRIATGGTGILPDGDLHPDLVGRLAQEAVTTADRVLRICMRAVDYLPPVDVTFGDYLRALITADAEYYPDDTQRNRLAFIDGFRERGILPLDVRTLAEETLRWRPPSRGQEQLLRAILPPAEVLRAMAYTYDAPEALQQALETPRSVARRLQAQVFSALRQNDFDSAAARFMDLTSRITEPTGTTTRPDRRRARFHVERLFRQILQKWISGRGAALCAENPRRRSEIAWVLGLDLQSGPPLEVHGLRPTIRPDQIGSSRVELIISLTQSESRLLDDPLRAARARDESFRHRGGCVLHIDAHSGRVHYSIVKSILSTARPERSVDFFRNEERRLGYAARERYGLDPDARRRAAEPFALSHRELVEREGY